MGEYEKALEDLERATDIVEDVVILEHLGDVYMKLGEPGKAREVYKRALEFNSGTKRLKAKLRESE
jgi:tetratricopeptide (TPR) repeat protein